jgi:hypothetical protein
MNSLQSQLPHWLQAKLNSCPRSPCGVHQFLFHVSRRLHAYRGPAIIESLLADAVKNCGRAVPATEIKSAVENAAKTAWKPNQ